MNDNWDSYVGIPFISGARHLEEQGGLDCWGLVRLIYLRTYNMDVGAFDHLCFGPETPAQNSYKEQTKLWEELPPSETPRETDVILFRIIGLPLHVGCFIKEGWMLHSRAKNSGSIIEQYTNTRWRRRVQGIYRLKELPCRI